MFVADFSNPAVVALIVGIPTTVGSWLGYRLARRRDAVLEQSQIESSDSRGIDQVIEGLNKLVSNLQEDNALLRDNVRALRLDIEALRSEIRDLNDRLRSG